MIDAAELSRLREIAAQYSLNVVVPKQHFLSLIDELEKTRRENDTFVSGMADLAERANATIAKAVAERDSDRALLRRLIRVLLHTIHTRPYAP